MTKFTELEKISAVQKYLNGVEGFDTIAKITGVHKSVLQNWVKQYQLHGEKAFEKRYTNYTVQYKLDVLNYMNENGTSIRETAAIFNIPTHSTILTWKRQIETKGIGSLKPKKKGRPSMAKDKQTNKTIQAPKEESVEALQAEVDRLRMENAYLKKLNALVQNKGKSPIWTKRK